MRAGPCFCQPGPLVCVTWPPHGCPPAPGSPGDPLPPPYQEPEQPGGRVHVLGQVALALCRETRPQRPRASTPPPCPPESGWSPKRCSHTAGGGGGRPAGCQHPYRLCQVGRQPLARLLGTGHQRLGEVAVGPQLQLHGRHQLQAAPARLVRLLRDSAGRDTSVPPQ